jgi:hypothetical protein
MAPVHNVVIPKSSLSTGHHVNNTSQHQQKEVVVVCTIQITEERPSRTTTEQELTPVKSQLSGTCLSVTILLSNPLKKNENILVTGLINQKISSDQPSDDPRRSGIGIGVADLATSQVIPSTPGTGRRAACSAIRP